MFLLCSCILYFNFCAASHGVINNDRASTFYTLLDLPENERKAFYSHTGHSRAIIETVYQCPPSVMKVTIVGRYLEVLDNRTVSSSASSLLCRSSVS